MDQAFTVNGFCEAYKISRSFVYDLWRRGEGPSFYYVGAKRCISRVAAWRWQNAREQQSNQASVA